MKPQFAVGSKIQSSRTFAVGGLEPGKNYEMRVIAHNAAGSTPALYKLKTPSYQRPGLWLW